MVHLRSNHCVVVSVVVSLLSQVLQATPGLVLPVERTTGLGCIPEGRTVSYECTVTDDGSRITLWRGSAFNCPSSSSVISLAHSLFEPNGVRGSCSGLSAMSVGVSGDNYTSRLTLTATAGLNEMTVECIRSGIVVLGSDTLKTGASPSPPQSVMIDVTSTSSLTVSWTPPSDTSNVGGYLFTVTGDDCGCVSMNISPSTTSVSCSGWTASGQNCSFEVRTVSQDCGFTSDSVAQAISLRVPSSPTGLQVKAMYNQYGSTDYLEVHFMGVSTPLLGANLDSTISYTVTLTGTRATLQFNGVNCNTTNYCTLRVNGSQLSPADRYTVSAVASNIFGQGAPAIFAHPVGVCLVECDPEVLGKSPSSQRSAGSVAVPNGVVTYSGVVLGSVATLTCDTEYSITNEYNRTCMSDGHWSKGTLRCDQETTAENNLSFGVSIAVAVILTFLLTLALGISIGVFIVLAVNKWRRSENITLQTETETEMIPPPVIYEEPNDIKPDPFTQENVAYELVKPN